MRKSGEERGKKEGVGGQAEIKTPSGESRVLVCKASFYLELLLPSLNSQSTRGELA